MFREVQGARFFDALRQDRGLATVVVRREPAAGRMVILDVKTTEIALRSFLRSLDKAPLLVQEPGDGGVAFRFAWASGYDNDTMVRVQGILQSGTPGHS